MTVTEILQASLCKIAAENVESDLCASMRSRVGNWQTEESEPKGLPRRTSNTDETEADKPTKNVLPEGSGYSNSITGTGHGKSLGAYETG